jgi:hypothetical protein
MANIVAEHAVKQQSRYIRLSPTAFHHAPDCYGVKGKPDPLSSTCVYCFLRKRCQKKQEVVWR